MASGFGQVLAAIDAGSNSLHLLAAQVTGPHDLVARADESVLLGLGEIVDRHGILPPDARAALVDGFAAYVARARAHGAAAWILLGTEPMRVAADHETVAAEVASRAGVPLHVLTPEEEAHLTVIGVLAGRSPSAPVLVADMGGGSTECVLALPDGTVHPQALPTGSARLSRDHVRHDPPTLLEMDALRRDAGTWCASLTVAAGSTPERLILAGGTATNLLKLDQEAARERRLTRSLLARARDVVATADAGTVAARHVTSLRRASQFAAGIALTEALLDRFGLDEAEVSPASLREGAILAYARVGDTWRERLPQLASGW